MVGNYPYVEAEVRYAVRREYACTAVDVLARRTRLAFLNAMAAAQALPKVISIMQSELGWDEARCRLEFEQAMEFCASSILLFCFCPYTKLTRGPYLK